MFLRATVASLAAMWMTIPQSVWADTTISLHDAVRQGKVKVDVKSRGGAAGPTVRVEVQPLVDENLQIEVAPGTVLLNAENKEQNVAVGQLKGEFTRENMYRPGKVMVLADGQKRSFLLEVYCLDYAKKSPRKEGKLELAIQDKRVARILNPPPGVQPTLAAVQIAIWMDRSGITPEQARKRFRGETTEVDVQVARQLLAHAEQTGVATIPEDMPASVRVHVSKLFSSDPKVRTAAAETLGQLGAEALPAVSYLADNLLDRSTDKPLPASVVRVNVDVAVRAAAEAAADTLEQLGLPGLAPLVDSLRENSGNAARSPSSSRQDGTESDTSASTPRDQGVGGTMGDVLVNRLIARLENNNARVRERAAWLLGTAGNRQAVEPLIQLLKDENERVRASAANALQSLTDQDFGSNADQWQQWWENSR